MLLVVGKPTLAGHTYHYHMELQVLRKIFKNKYPFSKAIKKLSSSLTMMRLEEKQARMLHQYYHLGRSKLQGSNPIKTLQKLCKRMTQKP